MPSLNPVRKKSIINDGLMDQNGEISGRDNPPIKSTGLANQAQIVSRARVTLPKPLKKGTAPTLA